MDALDWLQLPYFHAIMGNHELLHLMQDFSSATANGMTWADSLMCVNDMKIGCIAIPSLG